MPGLIAEEFLWDETDTSIENYPVDWWSLGVVAYEMFAGERPYDIHSQTGVSDVRQLFLVSLNMPQGVDRQFGDLLRRLLSISPGGRCSSLDELKKISAFQSLDYETVFQKRYKPAFCPPKDHLNCDPTFELEEMIVETRPLHKKKKRLAKQKSIRDMQVGSVDLDSQNSPTLELTTPNIIPEFITYNRYIELEKRERERIKKEREIKEEEWEKELATAMGENVNISVDDGTASAETSSVKNVQRTQDGCDILVNSNNLYSGFAKVHDDDSKYYYETIVKDPISNDKDKCNSLVKNKKYKCRKLTGSVDESPVKYSDCENEELGCCSKDSSKNDKTKFSSESDFLNMKKKSGKIGFERGIFSFKEKCSSNRWNKNFARASSLKVSNVGKDGDEAEVGDTSENDGNLPDFSDNVKNRIAHSPKLKNLKSTTDQRNSTFMADASYQKTKNEVMKNYQASLCSSLKTDNVDS